jgi:hypothetical protein
MTVTLNTEGKGGTLSLAITGVASTDNAGVGSFANPFGVDVLIVRATLRIITPSTGAANLGIGVTTAAAKATDILNDLDVNGSGTDVWFNGHAMQNTAKTQISAPAVWTAAKYVTLTGSATTVGFTGTLYLECIPV